MGNLITIIVVIIVAAILIPVLLHGAKDMSAQIDQSDRGNQQKKRAVSEELNNMGFNIDKTVYLQYPEKLWNMQKRWIPCVYCFLFVDDKNKQWAISQQNTLHPKIYKYSDFVGFDVELNGKGAGDTVNNALVGYVFGGLVGAAAAAALTNRNGMITDITVTIRVNSLQNPVIRVPLFTGPNVGYRDNASGFTYIADLAAQMEQTFTYINDNK
ncbi:MAG: hypothetical protein LBL87_02830 [Ruminococcus sp.]|jgi:hypothetical protein|nr:hypothetical protein [Ruminococcus sp.]